MTVTSQFRKALIITILVTLSSGLLADVSFFSLKNSKEPIVDPEIAQGGALLLRVPKTTLLWFNDKPVFVDAEGQALIALGRDATQALLRWHAPKSLEKQQQIPVRKRHFAIERVDGLPPAKVTAPMDPKIQERIRKESRDVRSARTVTDSRTEFLDGFIWPVKGRLSGHYGSQRILNGKPKSPHYGVDVAVATGTPVVAPAGGKVIYSNTDMYYSGGTLVIDHGHGLSSTFLHLSELLVTVGEEVKQGQVVAKVGATGRATGPHLDWRMNLGPSIRIDPELVVAPMNLK